MPQIHRLANGQFHSVGVGRASGGARRGNDRAQQTETAGFGFPPSSLATRKGGRKPAGRHCLRQRFLATAASGVCEETDELGPGMRSQDEKAEKQRVSTGHLKAKD